MRSTEEEWTEQVSLLRVLFTNYTPCTLTILLSHLSPYYTNNELLIYRCGFAKGCYKMYEGAQCCDFVLRKVPFILNCSFLAIVDILQKTE